MKATVVGLFVCIGGVVFAQAADVVANVRSAVSTVVSELPDGNAGTVDYLRNFGIRTRSLQGYQHLVAAVSNNSDAVCSNFNACATNEISRLVLLTAWWGGNDSLYLDGLSRSLDLAIDGTLSREDIDWYRTGHRNERRGNILALRYDEPGITNLVLRYYGYMGETNNCNRILSGEAKRTLLRYLEEISHLEER